MAKIPQDVVETLQQLQPQIWQTVSLTTSEAFGQAVSFGSPTTSAIKSSTLYSEISSPMMVAQFAFAAMPGNVQVVLVPQETLLGLLGLVQGSAVEELDENVVSELRAPMEGIVQGLCLSVGNLRNEPMTVTGMSLRYQVFNYPPNLQRSEELVRSQITITGDGLSGSVFWICDSETAHYVVSKELVREEILASPTAPDHLANAFGRHSDSHSFDEIGHLDILMDVPLEITAELGRVKMQVRDILELTTGSVVEIDRIAGEPIDILVNGRVVAKGEVVVVEDNFGVRLTEILNPLDRANRALEAA